MLRSIINEQRASNNRLVPSDDDMISIDIEMPLEPFASCVIPGSTRIPRARHAANREPALSDRFDGGEGAVHDWLRFPKVRTTTQRQGPLFDLRPMPALNQVEDVVIRDVSMATIAFDEAQQMIIERRQYAVAVNQNRQEWRG